MASGVKLCSRSDMPLAERLRPTSLHQFVIASNPRLQSLCARLEQGGVLSSVLLYGPPGVGKTTWARIAGRLYTKGQFFEISAATTGIKELKSIVERLKEERGKLFGSLGIPLVFIDEIHRFNRSQQDYLLPLIEAGTLVCIGATTEVPSFSLTAALNSRFSVVTIESHTKETLGKILENAVAELGETVEPEVAQLICERAQGDARMLLSLVQEIGFPLSPTRVENYFREGGPSVPYGEEHKYQLVSALIKSLRGSDADAALFWCFRMVEAGEDPQYLFRRLVIFSSEDIGNADPRALPLALAAAQAYQMLGMPEGRIPLAQLVTYLAGAPKSNRSYIAMHRAVEAARNHSTAPVPLHLRNAAHQQARQSGAGIDYQYPHDFERGFVDGVDYLPEQLQGSIYYEPSERGYELRMKERWQWLRREGEHA